MCVRYCPGDVVGALDNVDAGAVGTSAFGKPSCPLAVIKDTLMLAWVVRMSFRGGAAGLGAG